MKREPPQREAAGELQGRRPGGTRSGECSGVGASGANRVAAVELELRRVAEGEVAQRRERPDANSRAMREEVEAALELEIQITRGRVEIALRAARVPCAVGEFRLLEMERPRAVIELHAQAFEPVAAAPQRVALKLRGGAQPLPGCDRSPCETDFQRGRRARASDFLDFVGDGVRPTGGGVRFRACGSQAGRRERKTFRVQQLAAGGNLDAVEIARRLGQPHLAGHRRRAWPGNGAA